MKDQVLKAMREAGKPVSAGDVTKMLNADRKEVDKAFDLYINDFHRSNSMAAQREVRRMSLHPYSQEQKLQQIETLHRMSSVSKEIFNEERSKRNI